MTDGVLKIVSLEDPTIYKIVNVTSSSTVGQNTYVIGITQLVYSGSGPGGAGEVFGFIYVPNGADGAKGDTGDKGEPSTQAGPKGEPSTEAGPKGEPSTEEGPAGAKGEPGFDFEYEHVALNPVARDEIVTTVGVAKAFVKVPTSIDSTNYYLHSIESSWGTTANSQDAYFRLKKVDSAGNPTTVHTWTHAANTYYDTESIGNQTIDNLGGQYIYIQHIDGSLDAYGYSATLIWKRK
jgi:hypothetical protein